MAHGKIKKSAVLYLHKPDTQYQCKDCSMWLSKTERCTIHGPSDVIKGYGSCGLFVKGPAMSGKPMNEVTTLESGYAENRPGFSCKRCKYFLDEDWDCREVDRFSDGDDYGVIHPDGCCNNWESIE